jgi:putative transposase
MKCVRFSEEQIIGVLKEAEAGAKTADLARRHGVSEATIYNWKAKYGGLEVSEARRLRALESENAKLKRLLADDDRAVLLGAFLRPADILRRDDAETTIAPCKRRGKRAFEQGDRVEQHD